MRCAWLAVAAAALWCTVAAAGDSPAVGAGREILNEASFLRAHLTWSETTPAPRQGWTGPGFDDSAWARWRIGNRKQSHFTYGDPAAGALSGRLRLLCLRGRFTVSDPATADLVLSLSYRGGTAVYVNGNEVKRQHLAAGAAPIGRAEAYPNEVFYMPNGQPFRTRGSTMDRHRERVEKRVRKLEGVKIPAALLRKGTNVLALEIHASPFESRVARRDSYGQRTLWNHCGPVSLKLRGGPGAVPNVSRPKGIQIWNATTTERIAVGHYCDPHEKTRPVRIVAARGGAFCAQVVISSDSAISDLRAAVGDLRCAGGGEVPSSAVSVYYAQPRGWFFDALASKPPTGVPALEKWSRGRGHEGLTPGAVQPVWIKVRVPADAKAGDYLGNLTVNASRRRFHVPLQLKISEWNLPAPKQYKTTVGLIQSPDTLALKYKVPMWSDRHFQLMERSYALLGEVGNKFVWLPLIAKTNLGNTETVVRWRQSNGHLQPDFTVLDRYLDLVGKYLEPEIVCLWVYDSYIDYTPGTTRSRVKMEPGKYQGTDAGWITVLDASGKSHLRLGPKRSSAEGKAFWTSLLTEVRARLKKRGWDKAAMLGAFPDLGPRRSTSKFFADVAPGLKWVAMTHGASDRAGYNTRVYVGLMPPPAPWDDKRRAGWRNRQLSGIFPRSHGPATQVPMSGGSHPALHGLINEAALLAGLGGVGRTGADFWPVLDSIQKRYWKGKHSFSVAARYPESCWDQLNMDRGTEWLLAPGPDGAVSTVRFESLREGVQECEARIFIETTLYDPARRAGLGTAVVQRCRQVLDERHAAIRTACLGSIRNEGTCTGLLWYAAHGSAGLREKLFDCAAQVAAKLRR